MACKNHTIKVSDETWAAWVAHAARAGLSVTKMLVACVDAHRHGLEQTAQSARMAGHLPPDQRVPDLPGVKKAIELSEEKPYPFATGKRAPGTPMTATEAKFKPFTKDQQLKKGGKK